MSLMASKRTRRKLIKGFNYSFLGIASALVLFIQILIVIVLYLKIVERD